MNASLRRKQAGSPAGGGAPVAVPDFDALYRADPDPWRVATSAYEQRKLGIVLACLTAPTYTQAWDPGCGTGELAARLAPRCTRVLASDAAPEAVRLTRVRCAQLSNVVTAELALPAPPEVALVDLVVLSEFVYYLDAPDRADALALLDQVCRPDAELVSVHWRPKPHDAWLSGAAVQHEIDAALTGRGWTHATHHEDIDFVLDVHRRTA